jgi:hypothetical protein
MESVECHPEYGIDYLGGGGDSAELFHREQRGLDMYGDGCIHGIRWNDHDLDLRSRGRARRGRVPGGLLVSVTIELEILKGDPRGSIYR